MTPAKGKSPLDRKKSEQSFNGSSKNSIEQKILTGEWTLPGKSRAETLKAYRAWQKDFRINSQSVESWYRKNTKDANPHASTY